MHMVEDVQGEMQLNILKPEWECLFRWDRVFACFDVTNSICRITCYLVVAMTSHTCRLQRREKKNVLLFTVSFKLNS